MQLPGRGTAVAWLAGLKVMMSMCFSNHLSVNQHVECWLTFADIDRKPIDLVWSTKWF